MCGVGALIALGATRGLFGQLREVTQVASAISAGQRDKRFGAPYAAHEFGDLKQNLDGMLDRMIALIQAHQDLSDTVAHELRTPLNRINQKLEQIEGQSAVVEDLRMELHRTVRIFDSLLSISTAEAKQGDTVGFAAVDLSELCAELEELYAPLAEDTGMTLVAETDAGQVVFGDTVLLTQMLINLIENGPEILRTGG